MTLPAFSTAISFLHRRHRRAVTEPTCCSIREPVTSLRRGLIRRGTTRGVPEPDPVDTSDAPAKQTKSHATKTRPQSPGDKHRVQQQALPPPRRTGFNTSVVLTTELADALTNGERVLTRAEIAKFISDYAKKNNLQDLNNGRIFVFDEKLSQIFPDSPRTVYFREIVGILARHIIPKEEAPPELVREAEERTRKVTELPRSPPKLKKLRRTRRSERIISAQNYLREQKRGMYRPVHLSKTLSEICGDSVLCRSEVVRRVWKYIKRNNLQDSADKRIIKTDTKLRMICDDADVVDCFRLSSFVAQDIKRNS